jgi:hydroxymethyl cephem carbamoyltransferase
VTNDSGSAIGTAADAALLLTGDGTIAWDVYSGLDFVRDVTPDPATWLHSRLDHDRVARRILDGRITAWVQGRWEIGPRALGNRSLLASPFDAASRDRLNQIKERESYRPIAPCCREEDLAALFDEAFPDPYMLYFRKVISPAIPAVTHVDGTARVQTVGAGGNPALHRLLTAVAGIAGTGVLCNTSLNWPGLGFINRLSDLLRYCERRGVTQIVAGDDCYVRAGTDPA